MDFHPRTLPTVHKENSRIQTPHDHFREGAFIVESNTGDAAGASRAALERGISELEAALDGGYEDRGAIHHLIAEAYRSIGLMHSPGGSHDERRFIERSLDEYRKAVAASPKQVASRMALVELLPGGDERTLQLRAILALEPDNARAHLDLGNDLMVRGDRAEGARHLRSAVSLCGPGDLDDFGDVAVRQLRSRGLSAEADALERMVRERRSGSRERGAGP